MRTNIHDFRDLVRINCVSLGFKDISLSAFCFPDLHATPAAINEAARSIARIICAEWMYSAAIIPGVTDQDLAIDPEKIEPEYTDNPHVINLLLSVNPRTEIYFRGNSAHIRFVSFTGHAFYVECTRGPIIQTLTDYIAWNF